MILLFLVLFIACASPPTASTPSPTVMHPLDTTRMTQNVPMFFPQLRPTAGERAYPDAAIRGTLTIIDGCLRLMPREGNTSYLIVWPPHVEYSVKQDMLTILDHESGVSTRIGEEIVLGGGEMSPQSSIVQELQQPLPEACPGPYWISSGLVS